ncbi:hypothetical protein [Escherichia coli]|uniref:hypothetical protein n=1 Tax=Escherichia coli TaxID=562 RepID=UPI0009288733|nr:hypothetical protein [Escherichia coli]EJC5001888.1 hypothetical protein [Escherichia coli]OJP02410.1 hypothetical protein BK332_22360 [Escherichia coli]ULB42464.1 hypothetical protein KIF99_09255 [Escherichia coli]UXF82598.1 hypothetical protein KIG00_09265 [Escherichia coli]
MSINGWYYLHQNGELIYKPSPDAIVDIRDSDFAVCSWPVDVSSRKLVWEMLVEAVALGANESRISELAKKWNCDDEDADMFASVIGVDLEIDGNQWCAHRTDFVNLQESPAGFGESKLLAMADLARNLGIRGGHMWRSSFSDLVNN